ncbi:histidine phosphatase family protein [Pseudomonas fluorescens]|nr:histidine phosphatase family protein [Pseudomonas fluorescens]
MARASWPPGFKRFTILATTFGDGLPEPVGIRFGKHQYMTKVFVDKTFKKTLEGTVIYLIRHATPLIDYGRCGAVSAKVLLDEYNQTSSIDEAEIADFLSRAQLSGPLMMPGLNIISSPINRAYATACRLFDAGRIRQDHRLKEFDLRLGRVPLLKMGLRQWFALHRVLWLMGISLGAASRRSEHLRAVEVADELYTACTTTGETTVVVSHGMFLRTVRKTLQRQGMQFRTVYRSGCFTVEALAPGKE